jgi:hypothetical protein
MVVLNQMIEKKNQGAPKKILIMNYGDRKLWQLNSILVTILLQLNVFLIAMHKKDNPNVLKIFPMLVLMDIMDVTNVDMTFDINWLRHVYFDNPIS